MNGIKAQPFGTSSSEHLVSFIRRDFDGIYFLDLLHPEITRPEDEWLDDAMGDDLFSIRYDPNAPSKHRVVLESVDKIIEEMINVDDERVRQKGNWLQTYRQSP